MKKIAFEAICKEPWAITPESLETIISIALRENETVEALEAKIGRKLDNTRNVTVRNRTAIIPIIGPIFRYANLFTEISGATALSELSTDLNEAIENSAVNRIVLEVDSPGGQAAGIAEFADMVRNSPKPVTAYVSNQGASAAYWIASAAHEVVVSKTSAVGSIGVVAAFRVSTDTNTIEIVSSVSPNKRPDLSTPDGRSQIQTVIDDLGNVFVDAVAQFRNASRATVLQDFGAGGVLVSSKALNAGMVDRIGSLEEVINQNSELTIIGGHQMSEKTLLKELNAETIKTDYPEVYKAIHQEGITKGRQEELLRIQGVQQQSIPGHEALIESLKFDGQTTAEQAAVKVLAAEKESRSNHLKSLSNAPDPVKETLSKDEETLSEDAPIEEVAQAEWKKSASIREEFGTLETYTAYRRAEESGRIRKKKAA